MRWPERIKGPACRPGPPFPADARQAGHPPAGPARQSGGGSDQVQGTKGKARVTFTVDPRVGARTAAVCGEWNDWSAGAGVMRRDTEGGFSLTVSRDTGRAYRFRYLLDGRRWDNDWAADAYVRNDFGGDDSVVDLTVLAGPVPSAASRTLGKKEAAKKAAPARTAQKAAAPAAKSAKGTAR